MFQNGGFDRSLDATVWIRGPRRWLQPFAEADLLIIDGPLFHERAIVQELASGYTADLELRPLGYLITIGWVHYL